MSRDASIGVNLIGRDVSASRELRKVGNSADTLAHRLDNVSTHIIKGMGLAAGAVGALAVSIGVDAVKAALGDQKSTVMLTNAVKANTHATQSQLAGLDDYITKQQLRYGVDDDLVKAGLGRLVRVTHDVKKAQDLLNLSMNVAAGTGKSLDTVTIAVGKAYGGNLSALGRLGIVLDKHTLKTKDTAAALRQLKETYKGAGDAAANTFQGGIDRAAQSLEIAKQQLGMFIIEGIQPLADELTKVLPSMRAWVEENGPALRKALSDAIPYVKEFVGRLMNLGRWAIDHKDALWEIAKAVTAFAVGMKTYAMVTKFAGAIKGLATAFNLVKSASAGAAMAEAAATGGVSVTAAVAGMAAMAAGLGAYGVMSGAIDLGGGAKGKNTVVDSAKSRWKLDSHVRSGGDGVMSNHWNRATNFGGQSPVVINIQGDVYDGEKFIRHVQKALATTNARRGRGD